MLEELQHENKLIGMKQVSRSLREGEVIHRVYVAQDADHDLVEKISRLAKEHEVEVVLVESRKKLGRTCGIDVGATVVAVLK
ncbi:MAG: 50S ribosomal protein L7ae-like protein [Tindallia sp. MSAO_Bac2]|nr:MAG: 50S ribosomal protein L7ae-like protein [Tindallia sp. MSAO_Bac2]